MPKIISIGEILVEIMTKEVNQTFLIPAQLEGPFPSGAPAIFADSAAKMAGDVGMISAIGNDDFGRINTIRLQQDNVDISHIKILPNKTTGTAFVTYFDTGERQFIFHFSDSAAGQLSFDHDDKEYIKSAKYLHIMGCSISASENNRKVILEAVRFAKNNGVLISLDPNIRQELLKDNNILDSFNEILDLADILLTGKEEIQQITNQNNIKNALAYMFNKHAKIIVIKNGKSNVELYTKDQYFMSQSYDYGKMIDQTGAGDCFDGAFIAALSQDYSLENSLLLATTAGSVSVTKKGPMEGTSTLEYIKDLIKQKLSIEI
jgi:sugar/nucleoside kinase (ribokinase family)